MYQFFSISFRFVHRGQPVNMFLTTAILIRKQMIFLDYTTINCVPESATAEDKANDRYTQTGHSGCERAVDYHQQSYRLLFR